MTSLSEILTTVQQGVTAVNNLGQLLTQATTNSSSIRVSIASTYFVPSSAFASSAFIPSSAVFSSGTVTAVNTAYGLTGGPITISGTLAVNLTFLTASTSANIAISSAGTYADGPSVAQGTSGTWVAFGNITVNATTASNIFAKLWDGTTVIDSANQVVTVSNNRISIAMSGALASPAGNIRISAANADAVPSTIEFNRTGNNRDSTITVVRIA